ncbi:cilia- and flagella-associated protein 251-like [Schistocerca nitens]|uniref:cilia- and flagella-associated protein 251-like n=1 Tax=Schistocerca nitens TaxID=7011 RepID=UPI0021182630|nr:cilia- and flagella-associated protein 251-like [Schistocerca nitens]
MLHEVKYMESGAVGKNVDKIKFCDLLKLYLNHRPAKGVPAEKLKSAFATFARKSDGHHQPVVRTTDLVKILEEKGEGLSVNEIHEYLRVLWHQKCPPMTELSHSDISITETTHQTTDTAVVEIPELSAPSCCLHHG